MRIRFRSEMFPTNCPNVFSGNTSRNFISKNTSKDVFPSWATVIKAAFVMALLTLATKICVSTVNGSDASLDSHGARLKPPWSTKISCPLRVMTKAHPTGGATRPSSVWSAFHVVDRKAISGEDC